MVIKQSIHTLFIVTLLIILTDNFNLKCDPVHELSKDDAVLSLEIPNFTKTFVMISKQNTDLLTCNKRGCYPINCCNPFIINFNNKTWFENNTLIITISINGSWREQKKNNSAIGYWRFSFPDWDTSTFCKLETYAIHGEPECLLEEFTITCSIDKVYPKALCHFNITYNDSGHVYEHITYHHEELENGTYYKTSCTYWSNTVKEKNFVAVTLYPNVTGKKTDMQYGKTISLNLLSNFVLSILISFSFIKFMLTIIK